MEAARRLDLDGHDVVLMEQLDRLGGTLRFASLAYPENGLLLEWLQGRLKASKVDVKVGVRVDVELLHKLKPDAILIATGATRRKPPIPGAHLPHVFGGDDLKALILGGKKGLKDKVGWGTRVVTTLGAATGLSDNVTFIREATRHWMPFGKHVTIIGGDLVGLELAEFLTDRDRVVTVIDEAPQFGAGLQYVRRSQMIEDLGLHHVELAAGASGIQIQKDAVTFVDQSGSKQSRRADHVILAKGATGDLTLAYELQSQGFDVHTAGDCRGVGYIEGAIRGAAEAATAISGGVLAHMPKESRR
jgi:NADPH-dependent 2,4-dienoyl-CoA reductase/sulfur reductase-like enzyme